MYYSNYLGEGYIIPTIWGKDVLFQLFGGNGLWRLLVCVTSAFSWKKCEKNLWFVRWYFLSTSSIWFMIKCFRLVLHVHDVMRIPMRSQPSGERYVYIKVAQHIHMIELNQLFRSWHPQRRSVIQPVTVMSLSLLWLGTCVHYGLIGYMEDNWNALGKMKKLIYCSPE